ncbi:MAG: hypothetical protein ABIP94_01855, partial [Planctomycetota bacterium]
MKPHTTPFLRGTDAPKKRTMPSLFALLLCTPLAAQQWHIQSPPAPDPVKGWPDASPLTEAERLMLREPRAPDTPHLAMPAAEVPELAMYGAGQTRRDRVYFDHVEGHIWALGSTYKASFGPEGFVYIPFLGSEAPKNYPVQFVLRSVRIGGQELRLEAAAPVRFEQSVRYERGAVREQYDLRLEQVEQTFVVDSNLQGDVDVDLQVLTELTADTTAGLQFGNQLGCVHYGAAHVVDGAALFPVETTYAGNTIRIHVPAAKRGQGALVIDPLIQTSAFTAVHSNDASQPDIAYDASADQYLVVWQHPFSGGDFDIWSEFRNGNGTAIPGSLASIDFTAFSHQNPRVANLYSYSRFLVVSQRYDGTHWAIWGRLRLTNALPHPIVWQISDVNTAGDAVNPDIGGDGGPGSQWLVAWERDLSATESDIHARTVNADTSFGGFFLQLENTAGRLYSQPSVSQSNGNGFTASPRWMVVYQFRFSALDYDIYGSAVAPNGGGGNVTCRAAIDTSGSNDLVPTVTSPATDFGGSVPMFMVTYERQSPFEAVARLVTPTFSNLFVNQISPVNLTQTFGLPGFWVRA